jgi:hypothetical protein
MYENDRFISLNGGLVRYSVNSGASWRDTAITVPNELTQSTMRVAPLGDQWIVATGKSIYFGHPFTGLVKQKTLPDGNPYTAPLILALKSNGTTVVLLTSEPEQGSVTNALMTTVAWSSTNGTDWVRTELADKPASLQATSGGFIYYVGVGNFKVSHDGITWSKLVVSTPATGNVNLNSATYLVANGQILVLETTSHKVYLSSMASPTTWIEESNPLFQYTYEGYFIQNHWTLTGQYSTVLQRN